MSTTTAQDFPLISIVPGVCGGDSCIKGTRVPTRHIKALTLWWNAEQIQASLPFLTLDQIRQAIEYPEVKREA